MFLNLLSYFRFGQSRSETKTLQIVLESFCVHSLTHAFFHLSLKVLLACPLFLRICLPLLLSPIFPLLAPTLILPSLTKVQLSPTLTLFPLMIWCSGQTVLFRFLLVKAASVYLPTVLSVALRPLFQQAQYVQVFPLKPVPFCTLFAGLDSTNKSAIFLVFYYLTLVVFFFHLSSYLKLCGRSGMNCLLCPPVLSGYIGSPNTCLSRGTMQLMSWPDREHYLHDLQSLVVSLLLSLITTFIFSRTVGVLSHRSSLTHRLPQFPPRNLCSLSCSLCSLSSMLQ